MVEVKTTLANAYSERELRMVLCLLKRSVDQQHKKMQSLVNSLEDVFARIGAHYTAHQFFSALRGAVADTKKREAGIADNN